MVRAHSSMLAALLATSLLAAGCKKAAEPPSQSNTLIQPVKPPAPAPAAHPSNIPKPVVKKVVLVPVDDSKLSAEDQIREDAEATGMTSRLPADNGSTEAISPESSSSKAQN